MGQRSRDATLAALDDLAKQDRRWPADEESGFGDAAMGFLLDAWTADIDAQLIYASWRTGLIPVEGRENLIGGKGMARYEQCLAEFDRLVAARENPFKGSILEQAWADVSR